MGSNWLAPPKAPAMTHRLALLLASGLLLGNPGLTAGESATVQEILDGNQLYIDGAQAKLKQAAQAPQVISTGDSRGQLGFESGAVGRINRQSLLRLGSSCFLLNKGQILVSGKQDGCTRSSRMSVRGTNYVLQVDESGSAELSVLEGSVQVEPTEGKAAPVTVQAGQRLRLSATGLMLSLLKLSLADYQSILDGPLFRGYSGRLPGFADLESYLHLNVPGVNLPGANLPSIPSPVTPSLPVRSLPIPRFF
ncbi:MAG: hypothetical protein RLZZ158_1553 [Cyanobacteriota bacterium]|jgi:FecR protein